MASNYVNGLYRDYEKLQLKNSKISKEKKLLKLHLDIAENNVQRLEKVCNSKENELLEKDKIIEEQNKKIIELVNQLNLTKYERDAYLAKLNIDGTNAGIPTSQTPINKKKVVPNSRKKQIIKLVLKKDILNIN